MKQVILDALEKRYEAQIAEAEATLKIYLENIKQNIFLFQKFGMIY